MSIKPKQLGLKYDPPTLLLEYETAQKKKRRRSMPVKNLSPTATASKIVEELIKKNPQHLGPRIVSSKQLTRLIQKLIDRQKKPTAPATASSAAAPLSKPPSPLGALAPLNSRATAPTPTPASASTTSTSSSNAKALVPDFGDKDLNKLDDDSLKHAKKQMDSAFEANRKKPGDPGYQYDKRVEFKPTAAKSEWDDDADEVEEEVDDDLDWDELLNG